MSEFSSLIVAWSRCYGRKDLPWQLPRTAYRVWLSEIMLQQTQVKTVIPYFLRFINHFPELNDLALASEDEVLMLWAGLGYYSRGRNLLKTACIIMEKYQGVFPQDPDLLAQLPGIGASTARAITSLAYNQATAILDANVIRVLCRYFAIEHDPTKAHAKQKLWQLAQLCMPAEDCAQYTQAIMDFGALCCKPKNPQCLQCPVQKTCKAYNLQLVDELPIKKLKKKIPLREQNCLFLYNAKGEIYLKKNPPVGIWGGLWSTFLIDKDVSIEHFLAHELSLSSLSSFNLGELKHTFTHFHLHLQAYAIEVTHTDMISEAIGDWLSPPELVTIGIPKPIKTLLRDLLKKLNFLQAAGET
jgi:A/G-specific adenine glycosylase